MYESSPERKVESWRAVEGVYQLHCVPAQGVRYSCLLLHSFLVRLDIWDKTSACFQTLVQAHYNNGEDCSGGIAQTSDLLAEPTLGSTLQM